MTRTHHPNPLARLMPVPKKVRDALILRAYTALEAIASGRNPGEDEWRDLADVCNILETLTVDLKRLPNKTLAFTETASRSLRDAARRFKDTGTIRLDAAGLIAMRQCLELYEQCLETLTEKQMEEAFRRTKEVIEEMLRKGAQVVTL